MHCMQVTRDMYISSTPVCIFISISLGAENYASKFLQNQNRDCERALKTDCVGQLKYAEVENMELQNAGFLLLRSKHLNELFGLNVEL